MTIKVIFDASDPLHDYQFKNKVWKRDGMRKKICDGLNHNWIQAITLEG